MSEIVNHRKLIDKLLEKDMEDKEFVVKLVGRYTTPEELTLLLSMDSKQAIRDSLKISLKVIKEVKFKIRSKIKIWDFKNKKVLQDRYITYLISLNNLFSDTYFKRKAKC